MGANQHAYLPPMSGSKEVETKKEKTIEKPKMMPEEEEKLKNQFFLGINGYHIGEVGEADLDKMNNYVIQGDGIYLVKRNDIGQFITKIQDHEFPGLPKQFKGTRVRLAVPQIPSLIYKQIVKFFRDISDDMGQAEAFCQVHYDKKEKQYVVQVPEQTVSKATVNYETKECFHNVDPERYTLVFEIHSHNTMGAFWSGTDNSDEKDTRFYGVLGNLDQKVIGEKYRYMIQGKEIEIKKEHIFDFSKELSLNKEELIDFINKKDNLTLDEVQKYLTTDKEVSYPKEWRDNIKKSWTGYGTTHHGRNNHYNAGPSYHNNYGNSQKNPNSATAGKQTRSSQQRASKLYGNNYWEQWDKDDWEEFGQQHWEDDIPVIRQNKTTEEEIDAIKSLNLKDISERFDLGTVLSKDEITEAFESLAFSIAPHQVKALLDQLFDAGYASEIFAAITFDFSEVGVEEFDSVAEEMAQSMTKFHVPVLIEKLMDHGHHGDIVSVLRNV